MKRFFPALFCLLSLSSFGQQKPTDLDKSPMDMAYYPQNFPILKMNGKAGDQLILRVIYGRPQKAGRQIFGGIVNYDQVWRLGANEATEIEFFKPVKIDGKTIAKGRYSLFAICSQAKWTIILNSEKDIWGLSYNQKKDIQRIDVPVQSNNNPVEFFTIYFEEIKGGANMNILWDSVKVALPIKF